MLVAAASLAVVVHLWAAYRVVNDRPQWWQWWFGWCTFTGGLYSVMVWSYVGLDLGWRTPEQHMAMVTLLGPPLLLHPSIIIVAGAASQLTQLRSVRADIERHRDA